jgi:hypothetical protein
MGMEGVAHYIRTATGLLILLILASCGTYVPNITDNPFLSEPERNAFVQAILRNIRCELQDAVVLLYAQNSSDIDPQNRNLRWFDGWAAQMSVTLTIDEKGEFNPTGTWLPNKVFSLAAGLDASSEAQRVNKLGGFFLISELKRYEVCPTTDRNRGPFILSNLKLYDWLKPTIIAMNLNDFPVPGNKSGPQGSNVISHEVKFVIRTGASVTPMWILTSATVNKGGTLLSASRERTQDMTITFGPPDDTNWVEYVIDPLTSQQVVDSITKRPLTRPTSLAPAAANAAFSSQLSNDIANSLRNLILP